MVNLTSLGKLHKTLSKILRFEHLMSHFKVERCIFQSIPILSMLVTHSTSDIPLYFGCIFFRHTVYLFTTHFYILDCLTWCIHYQLYNIV